MSKPWCKECLQEKTPTWIRKVVKTRQGKIEEQLKKKWICYECDSETD